MKRPIIATVTVSVAVSVFLFWYYSDRGRFTTEAVFTGLLRSVAGQSIFSPQDPAARLTFASEFRYVGGQKFILYGVADTEQHFFVVADNAGKLRSLFWIQFEAYLPGKPYTYDYSDSPLRVTLDEYEFYADTDSGSFDPERKRRRGTDGAMARQLLAAHGYTLPTDFAYARLVYLTDASNQKELMIIFIDDLDRHGFEAADLQAGGRHATEWPRIEQAHLDRIRNSLSIEPL